ncbi:CLUMA_CG008826, isoform A [Clunio marinus]|uniref:CLUMA_CG008826, isoform A n=1 Tax=Clunio marinus TaxID=568069 RepID=A0A1J1I8I3_9DIPT|nr:CLUMA_CG008826, isoform A [Clunio marinus]
MNINLTNDDYPPVIYKLSDKFWKILIITSHFLYYTADDASFNPMKRIRNIMPNDAMLTY